MRFCRPFLLTASLVLLSLLHTPVRAQEPETSDDAAESEEAPTLSDAEREARRRAREHSDHGRHEAALAALDEAIDSARERGLQSEDLLDLMLHRAGALSALRRVAQADQQYLEVIGSARKWLGPETEVELFGHIGRTMMAGAVPGGDMLRHARAAVAIGRKLSDGESVALAQALSTLARVHIEQRDPRTAKPVAQEAVELLRRLQSDPSPELAEALNHLRMAHAALGEQEAADRVSQELHEMRLAVLPEGHPHRASSLVQVAQRLAREYRDAEAAELLEEALVALRRAYPSSDPAVLTCLHTLATVYGRLGRDEEAIPLFEELLEATEDLDPTPPIVIATLGELTQALLDVGRPAAALTTCERLLEQVGSIRNLSAVHAHAAAGNLYMGLGRIEDAHDQFLRRLEVAEALDGPADREIALALIELAHTARLRGRPEEASAFVERLDAVQARLGDADPMMSIYADYTRADSLRHQGEFDRAAEAAGRGLELARHHFGDSHQVTFEGVRMLRRTVEAAGRLQEARAHLDEELRIGPRAGYPMMTALYCESAALHQRLGDREAAKDHYLAAIRELEVQRRVGASFSLEDRIAWIDAVSDDDDPIRPLLGLLVGERNLRAAVEVLERGRARGMLDLLARSGIDPIERARSLADASGRERLAAAQALTEQAEADVAAAQVALKHATESQRLRAIREARARLGDARVARDTAIRERQVVLRDLLPSGTPRRLSEIRAQLEPNEALLLCALGGATNGLLVVRPEGEPIAAFGSPNGHVAAAVEALRASLTEGPSGSDNHVEASRTLFRQVFSPQAWAAIRDVSMLYVSPDAELHAIPLEALVVGGTDEEPRYWLDEGPPIAYVASGSVLAWLRERDRDAKPTGPDLVAVGDPVFDREATSWPSAGVLVTEVPEGSGGQRAGLRPGDVVVRFASRKIEDADGLAAAETARAEAGDGVVVLQFVREGATRTATISRGELGVRVSAQAPDVAGPLLAQELSKDGGALAAAHRGTGRLLPLPGTRREVQAIRKSLTEAKPGARAKVLLGEDATESALFDAARSPRFLHIATHGLVDESERASRSALALTPPQFVSPEDDGFLSLGDLLEHWRGRLAGTELVVLSACDSQRGKLARREGMLSLPMGFCYAGAPSVVGSLWKVDDAATADLMATLYGTLLEDDAPDKATALRDARRALRATHPHPYFWAPFVLVGDPR